MTAYVLSILGVVVVGVIIDIIIPTGTINKFIKSIYGIFVVLIIITPIINLFKNYQDYELSYTEYEINETLINYINKMKISAMEEEIITRLEENEISGVEVTINYSIENDTLTINSCVIDIKNMSSSSNNSNNNIYEIITEIVQAVTDLDSEVIIFNE